jgi:hypothetical protein
MEILAPEYFFQAYAYSGTISRKNLESGVRLFFRAAAACRKSAADASSFRCDAAEPLFSVAGLTGSSRCRQGNSVAAGKKIRIVCPVAIRRKIFP